MVQVLLEIILDSVYGLTVDVALKFHTNSCCRQIYRSYDVWGMILIQFESLSQVFTSY